MAGKEVSHGLLLKNLKSHDVEILEGPPFHPDVLKITFLLSPCQAASSSAHSRNSTPKERAREDIDR
jgi:hypothetical protein